MGWEKGKPIGRNSKTAVAPVEHVRRQSREGLGATPLPLKENNKKFIKPGETREGQPHTSERVRPD
jgi:G patch domain/KOW motif-containing protein